jgi:hypothetical protein
MMVLSLGTFFLTVKLFEKESCRFYREPLMMIRAASLASLYLAGNYFIVLESGTALLGSSWLSAISSMGWLFWLWTLAVPIIYVYWGIRKKDPLFLLMGLALMAMLVFTVRRYYHVLPVEWAMLLGGLILIAITYGLARYLKILRNGFTSAETNDKHLLANLHIESLIVAETFRGTSEVPTPTKEFKFGGGSGGGGGAGGEF